MCTVYVQYITRASQAIVLWKKKMKWNESQSVDFKPVGRLKVKKCLEPILLQAEENVLCYISTISQPIAVKFWILNLMTAPNKPYDTTLHLDPSI